MWYRWYNSQVRWVSPYLKHQAMHKRYLLYRQAKKHKLLNKQPITSIGAGSSTKRNSGNEQMLLCHDKGKFVGACPKSRKSKRASQLSVEIIAIKYQSKVEAL